MQGVIMAGGFGTRLRPLTSNIPKPMTPLMTIPIIEHIIYLLKKHDITDIIIILYYQSEQIKNYLKNGDRFGVKIRYVKPDADYGTAGAVFCAEPYIKDTFLIISGDVVTDFDLTGSVNFHKKKLSAATLILTHSRNPLQFGIVLTDKDSKIVKFYEKPTWSEVFSDTINTGIYILEKDTLMLIPKARPGNKQDIDFSKDLFPYILKHKLPLYGSVQNGYWRDVGSLEDYIQTNLDSLKGKIELYHPIAKNISRTGSLLSKSAKISKSAEVTSSIIGKGCKVGAKVKLRNCVLWDYTEIEENSSISNSVLCNNVKVRKDSVIQDYVFIGDDVRIGTGVVIKQDVKIWPEKTIDSNSVVTKNLVWEDRWKDNLFTDSRITGLANIEITPQFAAKLGMTFGVFSGAGSRVEISRDTDNISRMIKGAIISGLMSSGVAVTDLQTVPIPIVRQELKGGKGDGGIFVRKSPFDNSKCDIIFFDSTGKDLSSAKTKSIERIFFSEDYRPIPFASIGSVIYSERATERYKAHFLSNIDRDLVNKKHFKIVLNYSHGIAASIFPMILSDYNIELLSLDTHLDPAKMTRSPEEFSQALKQLSYIVTSLKFDAGFLIDAGGEKVFIVDDRGKNISYDRFLSIIINLYLGLFPGTKKIAVPIQASSEIDLVASKYGTEVIRVKDSHFAMMNAAEQEDIDLVGGTKGGIIFPKFSPATDGMFTMVKILEMLSASGKTISKIDKETPRMFMAKNNIFCTKEQKGKIMRKLVEESEGMERQLIDGIKIFFDPYRWVLCIPDSERELFHVNAEARTKKSAEELLKTYSNKIKNYHTTL